MTRNLVVFVIVLLVALAGFIGPGLATSPQADATTAPTMPAGSLTETPCGQENETTAFPPGASDSGIDNSTRLVTTHQAVLKNTSYRDRSEWNEISRISAANGTARDFEGSQYNITVEKGVNGTEVIFEGPNESNAYWFTDDATVTNISSQSDGTNSTIYQYSRGSDYRDKINRDLTNFSSILIEPYLRDLEYDLIETTTRNNQTLYTYTSTGINETVEANHGDTPVTSTTESINATVVVSELGVIHSFTANEMHAVQNETVTIEQNYTVEGIGETNVSAPAWVTEEIAQFNVSLTANRSVVAITHIGGMSVSDAGLLFSSPNATSQTTINGTIESGDTVYMYVLSEGGPNPTLQTSINEQPSVNSSFVSHPEGNLSVRALRSVFGSYDSGLTLEVTIRENPRNSTARNTTAEAASFPPGTSESGIDNATKLLETHRSQLNNETYTERVDWAEVSEVFDVNRTFRGYAVKSYTQTVRKGTNSSLLSMADENTSVVQWQNDSVTVVKNVDSSNNITTTRYTYSRDDSKPPDLANIGLSIEPPAILFSSYFSVIEYEYSGTVAQDGRTLHQFTSVGLNESTQNQGPDRFPSSLDRLNATVLIDQQGVIRALNASETYTRENETLTTGFNYSVRTAEAGSPTRPDWVCTQLPHLEVSLSGNGSVIALEYTGGMSVSTGRIYVSTPHISASAVLPAPFEPGETLYLYQTRANTDRLLVSRNEHPTVNESFVAFGGDNLSVTADRQVSNTSELATTIHVAVQNSSSESNSSP